jgi:hypothetical protein
MAEIPDTTDTTVAKIAVAWMITKEGYDRAVDRGDERLGTPEGRVDLLATLFNKAFYGLLKGPDN